MSVEDLNSDLYEHDQAAARAVLAAARQVVFDWVKPSELRGYALLQHVLEDIERNPDHFNMDNWSDIRFMFDSVNETVQPCGTTLCIAGHAIMSAGESFQMHGGFTDVRLVAIRDVNSDDRKVVVAVRNHLDTDGRSIPNRAAELLGLSNNQADRLFFQPKSIDEAWALAEKLTDGAVCRPTEESV